MESPRQRERRPRLLWRCLTNTGLRTDELVHLNPQYRVRVGSRPGGRVDVGRVLVAASRPGAAFSPSCGQHPRLAADDDDGVLDMRGQRAVCGLDRPPIARSLNCPVPAEMMGSMVSTRPSVSLCDKRGT